MTGRIAFQGEPGAYSHEACRDARPDMEPLPCGSFEETIAAVTSGAAELAMLPVENTTYGRVADIHRLLPQSGLRIVGEAFVRVHVSLMAHHGVQIEDVETVRAHMVLLPQCADFLKTYGIRCEAAADSAGAAVSDADLVILSACDTAAHPDASTMAPPDASTERCVHAALPATAGAGGTGRGRHRAREAPGAGGTAECCWS